MSTPNQDLRKLAEEIYEHNLGYEGESVVEWTEARLQEAEEERYQLLGLETGRDDFWIERAAKRICEETGLKNRGLVEELIASVHLPIADQQLSKAFVIIQRLRQSEAERDRLARALAECRTLAAVVADPDAKAPGKREVARDLLSKIDSLVATIDPTIAPEGVPF